MDIWGESLINWCVPHVENVGERLNQSAIQQWLVRYSESVLKVDDDRTDDEDDDKYDEYDESRLEVSRCQGRAGPSDERPDT